MKGREQAVLLLLSTLISLNFVLFRFFFTVGWSRETRWSYSLFLSVRIMLVSKLLQDSITLFDNYALVIAFENSSHILDENQNHLTIQDILLSCFLVVFFFVVIGRGAVSLTLRPWFLFFFSLFFSFDWISQTYVCTCHVRMEAHAFLIISTGTTHAFVLMDFTVIPAD